MQVDEKKVEKKSKKIDFPKYHCYKNKLSEQAQQ
jgi:hypothetical protein